MQRTRARIDERGAVESHDVGMPDALASSLDPAALTFNYCNAGGATLFDSERCSHVRSWRDADPLGTSMWCITDFWGWHDRTMSDVRGEEGNLGNDVVAICNGTARFRAWWRWDEGDSWIGSLDAIYGHASLHVWQLEYHGGFEDIDVRFRVDSVDGGIHRHTGRFADD